MFYVLNTLFNISAAVGSWQKKGVKILSQNNSAPQLKRQKKEDLLKKKPVTDGVSKPQAFQSRKKTLLVKQH